MSEAAVAELDIEALKETLAESRSWGDRLVNLTQGDLAAIIAALEDRDRLRALLKLGEIEEQAWRRLVYDNCGCIPEYPAQYLPEDFADQWRALEGRDG